MAWFVHRRLLDVGSRLFLCAGLLLACALIPDAAQAATNTPGAPESKSDAGADSSSESPAAAAVAAAAVEKIIRAQIAAFARDDSAAAFSFAAPSIQQQFGNPARFMEMVIGGYPMVYRPTSLEFGPLRMTSEATGVQRVEVSDSEATLWIAHYAVVLVEGRWRIAGVQIAQTQSKVI